MSSEVLVRRLQNAQTLVLNRPKHLNALNLNMVNIITPNLQVFEQSEATRAVILTASEGSKALCAGGDIKALTAAESKKPEDVAAAVSFMEHEYKLNHLIGTMRKPFISIMNGITMGGGVGLSVHAPFRIATENSVFAMPETEIGLFPDVGGSFFLPRLDGEIGTYLGLTGKRLKGIEVLMAGIATHYVPSERLPALLQRITCLDSCDPEVYNLAIDDFVAEPPTVDDWNNWALGGETFNIINRCFSESSIEAIVSALEKEESAWAKDTLNTLKKMSPLSLKATLIQLRNGRNASFANCFMTEYRMVQEFLQTPDFFEGVRAKLVEKRAPKWSPPWSEMNRLTPAKIQAAFLSKREAGVQLPEPYNLINPTLELLNHHTYFHYPHKTMSGFPTDRDVQYGLKKFDGDKARTLEFFMQNWGAYNKAAMFDSRAMVDSRIETVRIEGGKGNVRIGVLEKIEALLARE